MPFPITVGKAISVFEASIKHSFETKTNYTTAIYTPAHQSPSPSLLPFKVFVQSKSKSCMFVLTTNHSGLNVLCVANKTSLRSVVRVGVCSRETKSSVPQISSCSVTRTGSYDFSGGSCDSILSSLRSSARVRHLILDSVGNDSWVESFLLALVAERVDSLESTGSCSPSV
jgi:hypothetical protein